MIREPMMNHTSDGPNEKSIARSSVALGMSSEERLVYTVTEAAELLRISRAFAYELVARNELPVIRLGRRLLVPRAALQDLLAFDSRGEK
jgi:excisionase family DNA binding protein